MRFRHKLSAAAVVTIAVGSASLARADDPSRATVQNAATANYGVGAAAQLVALEQSMFYLYLLSLPPDQRSGVDEETWRTRGADVMTVPSSGPIADYYTSGASASAATAGTSDLNATPSAAAVVDAGIAAPTASAQSTSPAPEAMQLDASFDLVDASSDNAAPPLPVDGSSDRDADDEAVVIDSSGEGTPVGEEDIVGGAGAIFAASVRAVRHKSGAGFWFVASGIGGVGVIATALLARRNKRRDDREGLD